MCNIFFYSTSPRKDLTGSYVGDAFWQLFQIYFKSVFLRNNIDISHTQISLKYRSVLYKSDIACRIIVYFLCNNYLVYPSCNMQIISSRQDAIVEDWLTWLDLYIGLYSNWLFWWYYSTTISQEIFWIRHNDDKPVYYSRHAVNRTVHDDECDV